MKGMHSMRQGQDPIWSWVVSAVLHTLALGTAAPLWLDITVPPRQDTFRWQVAIRKAPPPEVISAEAPSPLPSADVRPALVEDLSPTELEALHAEPPPSFDEIDVGTPTITASLQGGDIPITRSSARSTVSAESETQNTAKAPHPSTASDQSVPSGLPAPHEVIPLGASGQAALPPPEMEPVEPSPLTQDLVEEEFQRIEQRPQAVERELRNRSTQPDYGWLAQSLWDKVQRFKRYPYLARMNRWEGNVVLEAVVRDNGDLGHISVVESSGRAILDQDAVETLRRCAPVKLAHRLGRRELSIQIPIMYRLD